MIVFLSRIFFSWPQSPVSSFSHNISLLIMASGHTIMLLCFSFASFQSWVFPWAFPLIFDPLKINSLYRVDRESKLACFFLDRVQVQVLNNKFCELGQIIPESVSLSSKCRLFILVCLPLRAVVKIR